MDQLVSRNLEPIVREAVETFRIVEIQGARQSGKTTLARQITMEQGGRLLTFDDPMTRSAASSDPLSFVEQYPEGLLAIDEIQRVPELVLALKQAVDRDPRPGRFLVTGSAQLLRMPTVQDSLAGRAVGVELFGFTQGELRGNVDQFIDRAFEGDLFIGREGQLARDEYVDAITRGSYPEATALTSGRMRARWFDGYIRRIVERDAPNISDSRRLADLPLVLRMIAARNAQELNVTDISKVTGIPATTLARHIELLEMLFLVQRVPAWGTNLSKRVVQRPKVMLLDTGLAARLINASKASFGVDSPNASLGHLLEAFVGTELRRQREWSGVRPEISHYRVHQADEVDIILESGDGRVIGIEVKASATVTARDARHLITLRDRLGARFVGGFVMHTGRAALPFSDRVSAVPIDTLWADA